MDKAAKNKLKIFLKENIPFSELKKAGFFKSNVRKTDYEKIAARICWFFGFKSIYEYENILNKPTTWRKLEINEQEILSQDKWLN